MGDQPRLMLNLMVPCFWSSVCALFRPFAKRKDASGRGFRVKGLIDDLPEQVLSLRGSFYGSGSYSPARHRSDRDFPHRSQFSSMSGVDLVTTVSHASQRRNVAPWQTKDDGDRGV